MLLLTKKHLLTVLVLSLCITGFSQHIKEFILDNQIVRTVRIKYGETTTLMFPSGINGGVYGTNITRGKSTDNKGFRTDYQEGAYYFSIWAEAKGITGSMNIVYNRRIYVFKLLESDLDYYSSVTFVSDRRNRVSYNRVSPDILLSLITRAKLYHKFSVYYPETVSEVIYFKPEPPQITEYTQFNITLEEVFRFEKKYDTLCFRIKMKNKSRDTITYDPQLMSVRIGDKIFYASAADASGVMPTNSETVAYFTITGTPSGGRNNLSPNNNWTILLSTDDKRGRLRQETLSNSACKQATDKRSRLRQEALSNSACRQSTDKAGEVETEKVDEINMNGRMGIDIFEALDGNVDENLNNNSL